MNAVATYCPACGRPLIGRSCPIHGDGVRASVADAPPRSTSGHRVGVVSVVGIVAAILLAVVAIVTSFAIRSDVDRSAHRMDAFERRIQSQRSALANLAGVVQALRSTAPEPAPSVQEIAARVRASVFTVQAGHSLGTAWVVRSENGVSTLITDYHVIADAYRVGNRSVKVLRGSGTFRGTVVSVSIAEDLAAIRVHAEFDVLALASAPASAGEVVIVVGSPYGLQRTVATGVVSARRSRFIQFSAPVSPGDSGAPVVNEQGQVLGVVEQKFVDTAAEGLSFAIPIQTVCRTVVTC